jgi:hypothetical protein
MLSSLFSGIYIKYGAIFTTGKWADARQMLFFTTGKGNNAWQR